MAHLFGNLIVPTKYGHARIQNIFSVHQGGGTGPRASPTLDLRMMVSNMARIQLVVDIFSRINFSDF